MNRLECIKSMLAKCHTAADIGTDHGYVAEMLLNENICEKVIATDLNKGPLDRAIKHLTSVNLHGKCDFRLGSGLTVLNENEADAIIIAGMGGELIADIIEASKNIALQASQLILQPMTMGDKLRQYLAENSFKIIDENIVKEMHHYYFVIKAVPGKYEVTDKIFYEISKIILEKKDPIMVEYLNKILKVNENIIVSIEKSNGRDYNEKAEALRTKNKKIRELMEN
ncbi:SAM-dependent methyltransferase [Sedimentibacter hydroxybenzoicus DSM 7310]|uniref:SAM-dependent methyltransferase n=1 Tax=Sedimentibacter hydroxybenzoicus DSM 7310 TaxID=1123245 RepID=A0A974GVM8_SEDHY|nr:class I SAM-dependent methyltransferase [Sedimentibacter hydroxybenzoicus]NYB73491.1 SAM-dependent methyltransferase [Sedimentibacter hydroxybenzoicus DSM 7310]